MGENSRKGQERTGKEEGTPLRPKTLFSVARGPFVSVNEGGQGQRQGAGEGLQGLVMKTRDN